MKPRLLQENQGLTVSPCGTIMLIEGQEVFKQDVRVNAELGEQMAEHVIPHASICARRLLKNFPCQREKAE